MCYTRVVYIMMPLCLASKPLHAAVGDLTISAAEHPGQAKHTFLFRFRSAVYLVEMLP